jgi:hypothetical protein
MIKFLNDEKLMKYNNYIRSIYSYEYLKSKLECNYRLIEKLISKNIVSGKTYTQNMDNTNYSCWLFIDIYGNYVLCKLNVQEMCATSITINNTSTVVYPYIQKLLDFIDKINFNHFFQEPLGKEELDFFLSKNLFNFCSGSCKKIKYWEYLYSEIDYRRWTPEGKLINEDEPKEKVDIMLQLNDAFPYNRKKMLEFLVNYDIVKINCYIEEKKPEYQAWDYSSYSYNEILQNFFDSCGNVYSITHNDSEKPNKDNQLGASDLNNVYNGLYYQAKGKKTIKLTDKQIEHMVKHYKTQEQYDVILKELEMLRQRNIILRKEKEAKLKLMKQQTERKNNINDIAKKLSNNFDTIEEQLVKDTYNFVFDSMEKNHNFNKMYEYITNDLIKTFKKDCTFVWMATRFIDAGVYNYWTHSIVQTSDEKTIVQKLFEGISKYWNNETVKEPVLVINNIKIKIRKIFEESREYYELLICKYAHNYAVGITNPQITISSIKGKCIEMTCEMTCDVDSETSAKIASTKIASRMTGKITTKNSEKHSAKKSEKKDFIKELPKGRGLPPALKAAQATNKKISEITEYKISPGLIKYVSQFRNEAKQTIKDETDFISINKKTLELFNEYFVKHGKSKVVGEIEKIAEQIKNYRNKK